MVGLTYWELITSLIMDLGQSEAAKLCYLQPAGELEDLEQNPVWDMPV